MGDDGPDRRPLARAARARATSPSCNSAGIMVEAARTVRDGGPAIGTVADAVAHVKLRSFEGIVPKTTDWMTLGVAAEDASVAERVVAPGDAYAHSRTIDAGANRHAKLRAHARRTAPPRKTTRASARAQRRRTRRRKR